MTTIGRDGGISGEMSLDLRLCAEIGAELARAREARGLSLAEVAHALLLSTRQVRALEQVDFAAFHNASFYVGGLKKYVQFVQLDPALIARATASTTVEPEIPLGRPSLDEPSAPVASSRPVSPALAVAVLVVAATVGAFLLWPRASSERNTPPAAATAARSKPTAAAAPPEPPRGPAVAAVVDAPPVVATQAAAATSGSGDVGTSEFGVVRVRKRTWVFVRSADGAEVERTVPDEGSLSLQSEPVYLAIGSDDARLTIGGRSVDLTPFVVNGQIRMRATDFDSVPAPGTATAAR